LRLLSHIQRKIRMDNWNKFISKLHANCNRAFPFNIFTLKFFEILSSFGVELSDQEKEAMTECFHLKDEGNSKEICIRMIFELDKTKAIDRVYKSIDLEQRENDEELSLIQNRLMPISEEDLIKVLQKHKNMHELWKNVKKYDFDSNGFLSLSELNSIFSQVYSELKGKSLFRILRPFVSIQNKSLADYKKLKEYLENRLAAFSSPEESTQKLPNELSRNQNIGTAHTFSKEDLPLSPREVVSPSMRRMEQIKDEILKAAESSPIIQASKSFINRHQSIQSPKIELGKKTALEVLVSPRGTKKYLPKIENKNFQKPRTKLLRGGNRVMSPDRVSIGGKLSQYSTFSSPFFTKANDAIKQKLAYEWRNIYRSLNSIDLNSSGYVTRKEFVNSLHQNGVFMTRDEISNLLRKYSNKGDVNYVLISNELGLHKSSYDFMRSSNKFFKNASLLKSLHGGYNESKSQYGDFMKAVQTERLPRHESTKGAIQFMLQNKTSQNR
jgi:transposase-like protein